MAKLSKKQNISIVHRLGVGFFIPAWLFTLMCCPGELLAQEGNAQEGNVQEGSVQAPNTSDSSASTQAASGNSQSSVSGNVPNSAQGNVPATQYEKYDLPGSYTETISVTTPQPQELMPIGAKMPPIRLEASYTRPAALRDLLRYAIDNNLALGIAQNQRSYQKWLYVGAFGKMLPDALMNYRGQYLQGATLVGGVIPVAFSTPNINTTAGFNLPGFRGGGTVFNILKTGHEWKASKAKVRGTLNDVLLETTLGYYQVMRNQALLNIAAKAVETSRVLLDLNQKLERGGTGTRFATMQSETQLARDEQGLLQAEVNLRSSAITLVRTLNMNMGINLLTGEREAQKKRLVDDAMNINDLCNIAILYRPELKQYEELRLAARRNIQVQAAALYPTLDFYGSVAGNGITLSKTYGIVPSQATVVPNGDPSTGLVGANTGSVQFPASVNVTPATRIARNLRTSYTIGFLVNWNYSGLGVPAMSNAQAARAQARIAKLQLNQQVLDVLEQVRKSYINSQLAERQIDVTAKEVASSAEQLRLARVRLANGVGTNLELVQSQRDWVTALVHKAEAIISFNVAQAQLLRDVGLISVDTLTSGRLLTLDSVRLK